MAPHRKLFRHMLIKMCRISGLYPECLIREDLVLLGTDPVAAGRFGEVWKGSLPGRGVVAVKILRVYEQCDVEKLLKVPSQYLFYACTTYSYKYYRSSLQRL